MEIHQPSRLFMVVLGLLLSLSSLNAQNIEISWSLNPEPDIHYYGIYRASPFEQETEIARVPASDSLYWDTSISIGEEYQYRILAVDSSGNASRFTEPVSIIADIRSSTPQQSAPPVTFRLHPNYPNPFNPKTNVVYSVARTANVSLVIYDVLGNQIKTLIQATQTPGTYQVEWNGTDEFGKNVASGIYLVRYEADDFRDIRKLTLKK